MYRWAPRIMALALGLAMLVGRPPQADAQSNQRCFSETGFCIAGRIRTFWEQNGGLPVFGLPITAQQDEQIEGKPFQVQWFERNRLELHPENLRPYNVLIGRLGVDRLAQQGRDWFTFAKSESLSGCRYFPETGHNICGDMLTAWHTSGLELDGRRGKSDAENLALFGLPLSDAQTETIAGKEYSVQWFERARFELHPENKPPYNVLLGLLGNEVHGPAAPPPAPPLSAGSLALDGNWSGTTAQGKQISFTVASYAGLTNFLVGFTITGCSLRSYASLIPTPINSNTFTTETNSVFTLTVKGTFNSSTSAAGTLDVKVNQPVSGCPNGGSTSTTWTANKQ